MTKIRISVLILFAMLVITSALVAQKETRPPASKKAAVTQRIGVDTDITISYSRPCVKGRVIWGGLVPYGLAPGDTYSDNKPYPWRGGANECTTIEFSRNVQIEGKPLPAGKYSLHFIPSEGDWVVIFNRNNTLWGSFKYNEQEDILRIRVTPVNGSHQEWLMYGFDNISDYGAVAYMHWANMKVPFKIGCEPVLRDGNQTAQPLTSQK